MMAGVPYLLSGLAAFWQQQQQQQQQQRQQQQQQQQQQQPPLTCWVTAGCRGVGGEWLQGC
jgi:hypothetical protein